MEDFYLFMTTIGVFYSDIEWARKIISDYYKQLPKEMIQRYINSDNNICLEFRNGTVIRAIPGDTNARGQRVDRAIVQDTISEENIRARILPSLSRPTIYYRE